MLEDDNERTRRRRNAHQYWEWDIIFTHLLSVSSLPIISSISKMLSLLSHLSHLSFLLSPSFWSRLGFLISYIATSFIVLEVLRLVYTDANKREVEKFLENYSKQRATSPLSRRRTQDADIKVNIDALERETPVTPPRVRKRDVTPDSEKTLVDREERRRRRAVQAVSPAHTVAAQTSTSPVRKLRKRSDTLNSAGSGEVRRPVRRHREASPASEAGSKVSSTHGSPRRKEEGTRKVSAGMGLGMGLGGRRVKV